MYLANLDNPSALYVYDHIHSISSKWDCDDTCYPSTKFHLDGRPMRPHLKVQGEPYLVGGGVDYEDSEGRDETCIEHPEFAQIDVICSKCGTRYAIEMPD